MRCDELAKIYGNWFASSISSRASAEWCSISLPFLDPSRDNLTFLVRMVGNDKIEINDDGLIIGRIEDQIPNFILSESRRSFIENIARHHSVSLLDNNELGLVTPLTDFPDRLQDLVHVAF